MIFSGRFITRDKLITQLFQTTFFVTKNLESFPESEQSKYFAISIESGSDESSKCQFYAKIDFSKNLF